jgi:hypothetical protein
VGTGCAERVNWTWEEACLMMRRESVMLEQDRWVATVLLYRFPVSYFGLWRDMCVLEACDRARIDV